jgi:hypothetical protein
VSNAITEAVLTIRALPFSLARTLSAGMASRQIPVLVSHLLDEGAAADARIVEQNVEGAEFFHHGRHDLPRRIAARDVAREGSNRIVAGMGLFDRRFRPVNGQHLGALVGKELGRGGANARSRTRHDRDLASQPTHGILPYSVLQSTGSFRSFRNFR